MTPTPGLGGQQLPSSEKSATDKFIIDLILKYKLRLNDIYIHNDGWKIISNDGIKNIIRQEAFNVSKFLVHYTPAEKAAVVSCTVTKPHSTESDRSYTALGEAHPDNNTFQYPVNVAEKRAESRAVLMMAGLYDQGVRGEDEIDHMVKASKLIDLKREQTSKSMTETVNQLSETKVTKKALSIGKPKRKSPDSVQESAGTVPVDMEQPATL